MAIMQQKRIFCFLMFCAVLPSNNVCAQATKSDEGKEKSKAAPVFAFVALNKLTTPTVEQVRSGLEAEFGKDHKIGDIEVDDKAVTVSVDGQQAMYGYINKPIPWTDLEGICKSAWTWPEATRALKNHPSHLIVVVLGQAGTHVERSILLTKLLSAASRTFDTAGIYWGHGSVVLSPSQIQKMAKDASKDKPPLLVWINFHVRKSPNGSISVVTEGLDYFDCLEIELIDSKQPFEKVLNTVMGVAHITIKGEDIKDGDTIGGENTAEKIKTRHAKSVRDEKMKVLRIDL
jgi:hypothetical protein